TLRRSWFRRATAPERGACRRGVPPIRAATWPGGSTGKVGPSRLSPGQSPVPFGGSCHVRRIDPRAPGELGYFGQRESGSQRRFEESPLVGVLVFGVSVHEHHHRALIGGSQEIANEKPTRGG